MNFKYVRKGKGDTLILQHGFLSGSDYWYNQIDYLSDYFDVIAPTLPGFGDNFSADAINEIGSFAEHLLQLVDALAIAEFNLLGHSMGGMIAQEVALIAPAKVANLVLYGTGPNGTMPGRFEPVSVSRQRVLDHGPRSTIENTVASWFMRETKDPSYEDGVELASKASIEAILGGYQAMESWSSGSRLDQIKVPTLVVWGDGDRAYKRDQVDQLLDSIEDASLIVFPGCSHNIHLEQPVEFSLTIRKFLQSQ